MARPKKEKELKRNRRITLRFTDVEYEVITENAKAAKLPLAEYVRLQALDKKVSVKYEAEQTKQQQKQEESMTMTMGVM